MSTFIKGDLDLLKELGSREARHRRAWDRESAIKRAGSPDTTGNIYVVLDINRQGILYISNSLQFDMVLAWKCGAVLFDRSNDMFREPVVYSGRTPTGNNHGHDITI